MDREYILDNQVHLKYLKDELSPDERAQFEIFLLDHPEFLELMNVDAIMSSALSSDPTLDTTASKPSWFSWLLRGKVLVPLALVSVFAIAVVPFIGQQQIVEPTTITYELRNLRSNANDYSLNNIDLTLVGSNEIADRLILNYFLPVDEGQEIMSKLISVSAELEQPCIEGKVVSEQSFNATDEGEIKLRVNTNQLKQEKYQLCAETSEGEVITRFLITITR